MKSVCSIVLFTLFSGLAADHLVTLEVSELEWNGNKIKRDKPFKIEHRFQLESPSFFLDSVNGNALWIRFYYVPVFNDTAEFSAFKFLIFDSSNRELDFATMTRWVKGTYDAGSKLQDKHGIRRWAGKLRYTPDTSVHAVRPYWRKDNYTFVIGGFSAWNATSASKKGRNKIQKDIYFQGLTAEPTALRAVGRHGDEKFFMSIHPIRYQWAGEVWMEMNVKLFLKSENGNMQQVLSHAFKSSDKNIIYNGQYKRQNAYEIRDSQNKYYMLVTDVMIIPY